MAEPRSPVLPLPLELRDLIYRYLLTETFMVKLLSVEKGAFLPLQQHARLAILNVSKSTYQEAKMVLCKQGHFRFDDFAVSSLSLPEIRSIKGLEMLQDITIHIGVLGSMSFRHRNDGLPEWKNMLIKYFASLESKVPRKRCVIEVDFSTEMGYVLKMVETIQTFRNTLSRLTGFRVVELKTGYLQMGGLLIDSPIALCNLLDKKLGMTLGEAKRFYAEGHISLIYHPQEG